jgi:hypothetical protein
MTAPEWEARFLMFSGGIFGREVPVDAVARLAGPPVGASLELPTMAVVVAIGTCLKL